MTTLYAVLYSDPDEGYILEAIFSDESQANDYIKRTRNSSIPDDKWEVQELTLDEMSDERLHWMISFYPEGDTKGRKWNITDTYMDNNTPTVRTKPGLYGTTYSVPIKSKNRDDAYMLGFSAIIKHLQETNPQKWCGYPFA